MNDVDETVTTTPPSPQPADITAAPDEGPGSLGEAETPAETPAESRAETSAESPAEFGSSEPVAAAPALSDADVAAQLEALLVVSDGPLMVSTLVGAIGIDEVRIGHVLGGLAAQYVEQERGFRLRDTAAGWALFAAPEHHEVVRRAVVDQQPARLSAAALETLAVVAYRQPVTRGQVAAIRGVGVDAVMRTLLTRGLVDEQGADPSTGAILYRTTTEFLNRLGIRSIDDLPDLGPYMPDVESSHDVEDLPST
jgi:segregation and condensation protein B